MCFATLIRLRGADSDDPGFSRSLLVAAASYVVVFGVLAAPLLRDFGERIPVGPNLNDENLIVWILSWVSHALGTDPRLVFDANINFPARGQLTGSDHFFTSQLLFGPLFGLTRNPILSANLTALATYPLAALAMQRLLLRVGCAPSTAWTIGLVFALGPRRVPFNLHILQYANLFLPLVALCLVRLRDAPTWKHAASLALVFGLGILSSFYMAVLLALTALVWGIASWLQRGRDRARFVAFGLLAGVGASCVAAVLIAPYFGRLGGSPRVLHTYEVTLGVLLDAVRGRLPGASKDPLGVLAIVSILVTIVGAWRGVQAARRCVLPALVLALGGLILMPGLPQPLDVWIGDTPLRFFAYPVRFQILFGFAAALFLAAALETVGVWAGRRSGQWAAVGLLGFVLYAEGASFADDTMYRVPALTENASVYEQVRKLAREHGEGPLLELPLNGRRPGDDRQASLEPDGMVGSTIHWLPLISAYTGYQPVHRPLVFSIIRALPLRGVVRELIDMTGLRWVLVRPRAYWAEEGDRYDKVVRGLLRAPEVERIWKLEGWLIVQLAHTPEPSEWTRALVAGEVDGSTMLGTPRRPLAGDEAVGRVQLARRRTKFAKPGDDYRFVVWVTNLGNATWPVVVTPQKAVLLQGMVAIDRLQKHSVVLVARWVRLDADRTPVATTETLVALRRDVRPGDTLAQKLLLLVPEEPGAYRFELSLRQLEGAEFDSPGNEAVREWVSVGSGEVESVGAGR